MIVKYNKERKIMQLHLQYLTDSAGAKTAVQIPFKEWELLAGDYRHLQQCDSVKAKFADAFNEISEIENKNKTAVTLKDFLHEC